MSIKDELIERYYNENGCLPSENEFAEYTETFSANNSNDYCTDEDYNPELLEILRILYENMSDAARKTFKKHKSNSNSEEFTLILLLFGSKILAYYILKRCYEKGFDFKFL